MPSKYPLWNGEIAVEKMEDSHLENALRRTREIIVDINNEIDQLEEWQTRQLDKLHERLAEWERWEEILSEEQKEREEIVERGERQ